jgi:hypothetical protein
MFKGIKKSDHDKGACVNDFHKLKLLYKCSKIIHCIEKDMENDARDTGDEKFYNLLEEMEESLEKFITQLHEMLCHK